MPIELPPCLGVVLAGGRSTRMGRDKALLEWRGRALIEHQLAVLREAGVDEVKVSGDRPRYGGVTDYQAEAGPLGGLAGIAQIQASRVDLLVIPVDMPLLQATLLRRLRREQPHARCLRFNGTILPMRWRLDARSRALLHALLQHDEPRERSLRTLQAMMDCEDIALSHAEARQMVDCNTEADWDKMTK
ncbi:molybdenum cofactor guanylyltransferase [Alcaligenaceae bacterium CGII-47]|nr:molybdenum cofactor guanylyltransferase [Alcaligenaceae bacterium CGII-47]